MKKIFLVLLLPFLATPSVFFAQQQQQPTSKPSRLVDLQVKYKLSNEQIKWLDSLRNPSLSLTNIMATPIRKKVLVKDSLYVAQEIVPVQAEIAIDTFSGYNEVIAYRIITTIISEKDEPGSFKRYFNNVGQYKKEIAARLRKEAEIIEKETP
jgi:hypothetical protein